jgi:hypothetical protein
MKMEFLPATEIEKQRHAWFAELAKPGMTMTMDELLQERASVLGWFKT